MWSSSDPSAFHMTSTSNHCLTPQVQEAHFLLSSTPSLPPDLSGKRVCACACACAGQCCAHLQCAAWSEGVCRGEGQSLLYVDKAIDSGSTQVGFFYWTARSGGTQLFTASLSPAPLSHLSRCVCSAVGSEHRCIAGRRVVVGATTSPVPLPPELRRTGPRDTHSVQDTHTQVHTHGTPCC